MEANQILWEALGFPVTLVGFQNKKVRGIEVPDVNMNEVQESAFKALVVFPHRFTGSHIRFIRSYLRLTQDDFAKNVNVTHARVSQWEDKKDHITNMDINTELVLRFYMINLSV